MSRPTPDGREWLSPSDIIRFQLQAIYRNHPNINRDQMEALKADLEEGFRDTGYGTEFKVLRLVERIRDNFDNGLYTTLGEVRMDLKAAFTLEVLDCFDENGNVLPECE